MRLLRYVAFFLAICAVIAAVCALGGALFAHFHGDTTYAHAIGWAMWIGGGLTVLLVGLSGGTSRMAGESRIVVGGRFPQGSNLPQPQSPFILIPAGILVVALGVLIYVNG